MKIIKIKNKEFNNKFNNIINFLDLNNVSNICNEREYIENNGKWSYRNIITFYFKGRDLTFQGYFDDESSSEILSIWSNNVDNIKEFINEKT